MSGETQTLVGSTNSEPALSVTVAETVAAFKGVEPDALEPLYSAVDPDALDDLFAPTTNSIRTGRIEFQYEGCHITVHSDGHVGVSRPAERE